MSDPRKIQLDPVWSGDQVQSLASGEALWDFEQLQLLKLWQKYGRGEEVNVYVIDSGIDDHNCMSGKKVPRFSFMDDDASGQDENGHGTWCCSKIGGRGVGIAPGCNLTSLRTLDKDGSGYTYYSTDALRWVSKQKNPHIVNMSLGSTHKSQAQATIIEELWDRGCIVVAAAGNEDTEDLSYPAAYYGALAVAAIDENRERAWFSNYGAHVTILAPGVSCYGAYLGDSFRKLAGTSMASPTVAGLLTLGYSLCSRAMLSNVEARDLLIDTLKETAIDLGEPGKDKFYGFGGIDGPSFMQAVSDACEE